MKSLIIAHCERVHLHTVDYFRIAHYWRFRKLPNCESFRDELIAFEDEGKIPSYVREYVENRISEPHVLIG